MLQTVFIMTWKTIINFTFMGFESSDFYIKKNTINIVISINSKLPWNSTHGNHFFRSFVRTNNPLGNFTQGILSLGSKHREVTPKKKKSNRNTMCIYNKTAYVEARNLPGKTNISLNGAFGFCCFSLKKKVVAPTQIYRVSRSSVN